MQGITHLIVLKALAYEISSMIKGSYKSGSEEMRCNQDDEEVCYGQVLEMMQEQQQKQQHPQKS